MKKKRVTVVAESFRPGNGGINRVARLTARVLSELQEPLNLDVQAISLSDAEPVDLGVTHRFFAGSRVRFIAAVQMDALQSRHVLFDSAAMARTFLVGRVTNQRSACWIHGIEIWKSEPMQPNVVRKRKIVQSMDFLFANSETTVERSGFANAHKCWLSTEGDLPPETTSVNQNPQVLILSSINVDYKGHREIIECWPKVLEAVPQARLVIAGKGPGLDALKKVVSDLPYRNSIDVLGFVPEQQLDELYASSSLFAMPSRGEGFGLVYIEAMRHGLPIIASIHDAGNEVNLNEITGYNINLDVPSELPDRMIRLLGNRKLAEQMGINAFERWKQNFSYACFRERMTPLLHQFLEANACAV
jgi:phosphatidyl-myo-inositol dimannoside synthase